MEQIVSIPIELINRPNPPVRLSFNEQEIQALTESITTNGIMVPLLVRKVGERYEIIDGDCRLEASGRARIGEIPCVVRDATDSETHILRMLANLDRSDPDPVSEAIYIARAINSGAITAEEFADKLHRTIAWVENRLTIAEMPDYLQEALLKKEVGLGVALELFEIKDEGWRTRYVSMAKNDGMSVATAKACRLQWEETYRRYREAGLTTPVEEIPYVPPVVRARCERCNIIDDVARMRFVRIHSQGCNE